MTTNFPIELHTWEYCVATHTTMHTQIYDRKVIFDHFLRFTKQDICVCVCMKITIITTQMLH